MHPKNPGINSWLPYEHSAESFSRGPVLAIDQLRRSDGGCCPRIS